MTASETPALPARAEDGASAAAAWAGATGSLVEQVVEASGRTRAEIADRMGVSVPRLSQIVNGDGNLRVSTLGRLLSATGFSVSVTARDAEAGAEITAPRSPRRRRGAGAGQPGQDEVDGEVQAEQPVPEAAVMAAAALCGAIGSLIEQMVEATDDKKQDVALGMGVTPGRLSQLLTGDGNVRMSSLARVAHACGFTLSMTAGNNIEQGIALTVPRVGRRQRSVDARGGTGRRETEREAPDAVVVDLEARRRRLNEIAPVKELVARRYLPRKEGDQEKALLALYGIRHLSEEPTFVAAARRHNVHERPTPPQTAWLACARHEAAKREVVRPYSPEVLSSLAAELTQSVLREDDVVRLPARFAEAGVCLVHVPGFTSGKLSGASFTLDDRPVIAVTGRRGRMDMILFTILHEAAHVVLGHAADATVLDVSVGPEGGEQEAAADALASHWALPEWGPVPDDVTPEWVHAEAERMGVHPILVSGRLQYLEVLPWDAKHVPWVKVTGQLERW